MFNCKIDTPILRLNYLDENNNEYYIKRDDLLPFSFGGNKVRIALEYFKDMIEKKCNVIISYGNVRSNLNRVIANMSSVFGFKCYVISPNNIFKESMNSNLVNLMNVEIVNCEKDKVSEAVEETINKCLSNGLSPYYINGNKYGKGNEKTPVNAYVKAFGEIMEHEKKNQNKFDYIFHASGTGSTQSGLICGNLMNNRKIKIIGISVARNSLDGKEYIMKYIKSYFPQYSFNEINENIFFEDNYICGGYGEYNSDIVNLVKKILLSDGIPLDLTYTGKAFSGMSNYIKEHQIKNSKILFIHTGGTPLFFDDIVKLK